MAPTASPTHTALSHAHRSLRPFPHRVQTSLSSSTNGTLPRAPVRTSLAVSVVCDLKASCPPLLSSLHCISHTGGPAGVGPYWWNSVKHDVLNQHVLGVLVHGRPRHTAFLCSFNESVAGDANTNIEGIRRSLVSLYGTADAPPMPRTMAVQVRSQCAYQRPIPVCLSTPDTPAPHLQRPYIWL